MATAEQLKRQKDALTRAIKPATTQKQAEANMYRASLLEKLNNPTVTTTKTGGRGTVGGLEGRPSSATVGRGRYVGNGPADPKVQAQFLEDLKNNPIYQQTNKMMIGPGTVGGLEGRPSTATVSGGVRASHVENRTPEQKAQDQKYQDALDQGRIYKMDMNGADNSGPSNEAISWYAKSKGMNAATYNKILEKNPELAAKIKQQYADYQAANQEPVATYAEIGEANLAAEANTLNQFGYDLGLEADQFLTPLEEAKRQIQIQREAKLAQEAQIDEQQQQLEYDTGAAKRSAESALDTTVAQLTGSREGVTSLSNVSASDKLKEATGLQISRLLASQDASNAALDQARVQLAEAERSGNQAIIQNARNALLAAEQDAMNTETAYIAALTAQSEEERAKQAQQAQNVESFATLVQQGTEMDYNTIASLASQYGLPTDMLMGYYQGAQSIRDDKSLDNQTKAVQLAQLNQDLSDQVNGLRTTEAKNIDYLNQLRQMGASEEMISNFKSLAGITDYNDPLTAAELEMQQLENKIKQNQLNGIPTSVAELEDYFNLQQQINASSGAGGEAYISQSIDGISMSYEGGQLNVTLPKNPDGSLKAYQCGEFVNRAWGLPSGGSGGFGSSAAEKRDRVAQSGFFKGDKSLLELTGMVKPGMAFVSLAEGTDHTGLILSGVDAFGNFKTLEANVGDSNSYTPDPPMVKTRNIKDQDVYGFVYPPKGVIEQGANAGSGLLEQQANALIFDLGGTADERAVISSQMVQMVESGQAKDLADAKSQLGLITKSDRELQDAMTAEIKPLREDFTTAKSKLASLPALLASGEAIGDVASIVNFLKVIDPNSVARETEVQSVENATSLLGQFEQAIQKAQTGEKLTSEQRQQLSSTADIIASSFADTYLQELYRRQDELAKKGIPMTFASTSEISSLESFLGTDRVNQIKEGLGLDFEPTEDDYINTVIQDAENSDIYDYIDSASSSNSNRAFSMGIGSASPFKQ